MQVINNKFIRDALIMAADLNKDITKKGFNKKFIREKLAYNHTTFGKKLFLKSKSNAEGSLIKKNGYWFDDEIELRQAAALYLNTHHEFTFSDLKEICRIIHKDAKSICRCYDTLCSLNEILKVFNINKSDVSQCLGVNRSFATKICNMTAYPEKTAAHRRLDAFYRKNPDKLNGQTVNEYDELIYQVKGGELVKTTHFNFTPSSLYFFIRAVNEFKTNA